MMIRNLIDMSFILEILDLLKRGSVYENSIGLPNQVNRNQIEPIEIH